MCRFVQECLTNVHKHAQGQRAKILIAREKGAIQVAVEDDGQGISPEKMKTLELSSSPGVGIRGMRERLRQLGGSLDFQSAGRGTIVCATLPLGSAVKQAEPQEQTETVKEAAPERLAPQSAERADSANAADAA